MVDAASLQVTLVVLGFNSLSVLWYLTDNRTELRGGEGIACDDDDDNGDDDNDREQKLTLIQHTMLGTNYFKHFFCVESFSLPKA